MTAEDLHRFITVAEACRRLGMRATTGRAWLRLRGLIRRELVEGYRRPVERVYLAALVSAMATPTAAPKPRPAGPARKILSMEELRAIGKAAR